MAVKCDTLSCPMFFKPHKSHWGATLTFFESQKMLELPEDTFERDIVILFRKWTRWTSQMLKSWSKLLIQCLNRQIPHWLSPLHFLSGSFMTSWWLISGESHQKDHQSGFKEAVWHWLGKEQSVHSHWVWKLLVSIGITVDGLWKHTHIFSTSDY